MYIYIGMYFPSGGSNLEVGVPYYVLAILVDYETTVSYLGR